jgi:tellurite resistance protein TerC
MRAVFIALGAVLSSTFDFMFAIFGLLLVLTAVQLFRHRDQDPDVEDNRIVRAARRVMPITDSYAGGRMLTRVDGRRVATPLFIVFVAISSIDLLFALDSIPGRVRRHRGAVHRLRGQRLRAPGAARPVLPSDRTARSARVPLDRPVDDLAFIGVKLLFGHLQDDSIPEVQTSTSLGVIVAILAIAIAASMLKSRRDPAARAHAGSLQDNREQPPPPKVPADRTAAARGES